MSAGRDWLALQHALAAVLRDPVPRDRDAAIAEVRRRHPGPYAGVSALEAEFLFDMTGIGVELTHGPAAVELVVGSLESRDSTGWPVEAKLDSNWNEVSERHALTGLDKIAAAAMAQVLWQEIRSKAAVFTARYGDGTGARH